MEDAVSCEMREKICQHMQRGVYVIFAFTFSQAIKLKRTI